MKTTKCEWCGNTFTYTAARRAPFCCLDCRFRSIAAPFFGIETCWLWPKSRTKAGYGQLVICHQGEVSVLYAHRISHEIFNGPIPEGHQVCHRCDDPACFNPAHLFSGTQKDNIDDMFSKGRQADRSLSAPRGDKHPSRTQRHRLRRGADHYASKLTEDDVRYIRQCTHTGVALAEKYGVSTAAISAIRKRQTWKHI
jgi:hypothetical protein